VFMQDEVTIGGSGSTGSADVALMANLARKHATVQRSGESYVLQAHAPVHAGGKAVHGSVDLTDDQELLLGESVRLKFRMPTVMSGSARIEFLSDHRPKHAVDGIVIMDETCLLGPHADNHVRCPGWKDTVLLYRKQGEVWCKARSDIFVDGRHIPGGGPVRAGATVEGQDIRFRWEAL